MAFSLAGCSMSGCQALAFFPRDNDTVLTKSQMFLQAPKEIREARAKHFVQSP